MIFPPESGKQQIPAQPGGQGESAARNPFATKRRKPHFQRNFHAPKQQLDEWMNQEK
ncbi:hypothetical protein [Rhizobium sp. BR 362]|uniref:hypothetical protein n=1 Tax=Rhizobium sp. BR 362 TaxID=3040670 RepID=UPI002F42B284